MWMQIPGLYPIATGVICRVYSDISYIHITFVYIYILFIYIYTYYLQLGPHTIFYLQLAKRP